MTSAEWASATDPAAMLAFCAARLSDRKLRLYLVGCCRRRWGFFDKSSSHAIEIAELFADGQASVQTLFKAERQAMLTPNRSMQQSLLGNAAGMAAATRDELNRPTPLGPFAAGLPKLIASARGERMRQLRGGGATMAQVATAAETADLARLLRCIAGEPTLYYMCDPAWRTEAALALAESIYQHRAFENLPILADALEEAGCDDAAVLDHCRADAVHARGCWVVDAILGRE